MTPTRASVTIYVGILATSVCGCRLTDENVRDSASSVTVSLIVAADVAATLESRTRVRELRIGRDVSGDGRDDLVAILDRTARLRDRTHVVLFEAFALESHSGLRLVGQVAWPSAVSSLDHSTFAALGVGDLDGDGQGDLRFALGSQDVVVYDTSGTGESNPHVEGFVPGPLPELFLIDDDAVARGLVREVEGCTSCRFSVSRPADVGGERGAEVGLSISGPPPRTAIWRNDAATPEELAVSEPDFAMRGGYTLASLDCDGDSDGQFDVAHARVGHVDPENAARIAPWYESDGRRQEVTQIEVLPGPLNVRSGALTAASGIEPLRVIGAVRALQCAGYLDADGAQDWLVVGSKHSHDDGLADAQLAMLSVTAQGLQLTPIPLQLPGRVLRAADASGDLDGDGHNDLAIATSETPPAIVLEIVDSLDTPPLTPGELLVFRGPLDDSTLQIDTADVRIALGDAEPTSVSTSGDLDGDGLADIAFSLDARPEFSIGVIRGVDLFASP